MKIINGWICTYDSKHGIWNRLMPEEELKIRTRDLKELEKIDSLEEKKIALLDIQKRARTRRRKWIKEK